MTGWFLLLLTAYLYVVIVRFLLQINRADFYNPLSQVLVRLTDPLYLLAQRFVPRIRGVDLSLILVAWLLSLAIFYVGGFMRGDVPWVMMGVMGFADIVSKTLNVYVVALFISVIASWVQVSMGSAPFPHLLRLVRSITEPLLLRIRSTLPAVGMFDFSPMVALIGIFVAQSLLNQVVMVLWRMW